MKRALLLITLAAVCAAIANTGEVINLAADAWQTRLAELEQLAQ